LTAVFSSLRRYRNYRLYFTGQFVTLSGLWMQDAALAWLAFSLTHSSLAVGLLVFVRFAPLTLLTPFAGVLADRFDNRRALLYTNLGSMAVATALAAVTLSGSTSLVPIYALALAGGSIAVFGAPNRLALISRLVGREDLANAVALNSSLLNTTRVLGPAVAGMLIASVGAGCCFAVNAVSYLAAVAALLLMHTDELLPLERSNVRAGGLDAIREGVAFVRRTPGLRLILLSTAAVGIAGFNFRVSLPVLASGTLHHGAGLFGLLYASFGFGALAGSLAAAAAGPPTWARLEAAIVGFGAALLAIAPLDSIPAVFVLLFAAGVCSSLWTTTSQSILQLSAPDHLRGRVLSLYWFVFAGLTPLGSLLIGVLAATGGSALVFAAAGLVALATAGCVIGRIRATASTLPFWSSGAIVWAADSSAPATRPGALNLGALSAAFGGRGHCSRLRRIQVVRADRDQPVDAERLRLPLCQHRLERLDLHRIAHDAVGRVSEQHLPGPGGLLEPRRDVDRVAGDERLAAPHDLAAVDAHAHGDHRPEASPEFPVESGHPLLHLERRSARPQSVVLARLRHSEDADHSIADEPLHHAAVAPQRPAHLGEVELQQLLPRLRVHALREVGAPGEIAENERGQPTQADGRHLECCGAVPAVQEAVWILATARTTELHRANSPTPLLVWISGNCDRREPRLQLVARTAVRNPAVSLLDRASVAFEDDTRAGRSLSSQHRPHLGGREGPKEEPWASRRIPI
jgi:MFS family permease